MKCPHCKEHNLVMSERKGIEIDYCPECRGIWLDRGELDKILERSRAEETPTAAAAPAASQGRGSYDRGRPTDGYEKRHYKRKKSFLEELFD